jgi:hypothetical protein
MSSIFRKKISPKDIDAIIPDHVLAIPEADSLSRLYGLATQILIIFFGFEWVSDNIFGARPRENFLYSDELGSPDGFKHQDRVVDISEMLYNLQHIPGIESVIERIQKDSIEAFTAELQAAKWLFYNEIPFRFVKRSGQKGADFDALAVIKEQEVACEFKCKLEEKEFSINTIDNTLRSARKQLPQDKPSVIFVKIPENWTIRKANESLLEATVQKFFRDTERVNSVVFHWEEWQLFENRQAGKGVRLREMLNPNSKFKLGKILSKHEVN